MSIALFEILFNSFLYENTSHSIHGSGGFVNLEKGETETSWAVWQGERRKFRIISGKFQVGAVSIGFMHIYRAKSSIFKGRDFKEVRNQVFSISKKLNYEYC